MKQHLLLFILITGLFQVSYGQYASKRDTSIVPEDVVLQAEIAKMTDELDLTKDQQDELYEFLKNNSGQVSFSSEEIPDELLQILTFQQRETLLRLADLDEQADENVKEESFLKSANTLSSGQQITLSDASHIKDVKLTKNTHPDGSASANNNYSSHNRICMFAWTYKGDPMYSRTLMKFILDDIPVGSKITSAVLYLYSDPTKTSAYSADANSPRSGSNAFYIERIIKPWNDLTVTWNKQPASTTEGRLLIPVSKSPTENLSIDLSGMVQTWVNTPDANNGIKMFLQTEAYYRARNYGSMEFSNSSLRPRLVVKYANPEVSIEYAYDNAGNRVKRQTIIISRNSLKSASADAQEEAEQQPVTSEWNDIDVNIYPNPTAGDVSVSFTGGFETSNIEYKIYNAMGTMMEEGQISSTGRNRLPFSSLKKGVYILILRNGNETKTWKIIKQ